MNDREPTITVREIKKLSDNFWIRSVGDKFHSMLLEMGNSNIAILRWQKSRILKSVVAGLLFLALGYFFYTKLMLLALVVPFFMYFMQGRSITSGYSRYKFQRHLQFAKFTRLLVPYLKQTSAGVNLYSVFNKIVPRLEHEADKTLLLTLMKEMSDKPNSIVPFTEYAEKTSGSDMSILFMSTIYDLRQGTSDLSIITELGQIASEELMRSIDQIIEYKSKRFLLFPTKITMSTFLIVIGYAVAVLIYNIKDINIGM
ncbi:hypothetical protein BFC19_12185 (plasmid) [Brochothrix thermosphacta]|nr:hypothetical protein BFC19_12185 [Brochothrix thermosphacta]